jgi:hypothetical protein
VSPHGAGPDLSRVAFGVTRVYLLTCTHTVVSSVCRRPKRRSAGLALPWQYACSAATRMIIRAACCYSSSVTGRVSASSSLGTNTCLPSAHGHALERSQRSAVRARVCEHNLQ